VTGTPISSSVTNSNNSDIIDMLTDSIARDGQGGMQGPFKLADGTQALPALAFVADTNTGIYRPGADTLGMVAGGVVAASITATGTSFPEALTVGKSLNLAASVTVPSATTTDLGAAASNNIIISGVTTITSFGTVAAGVTRDVTFSGALVLTHNGTSLILPGGANITAVAGDTLSALSLGSGNWRVTRYDRGSGGPVGVLTSTNDTLPRFDGAAGALQTSGVVVDDLNNLAALTVNATGTGANLLPSGTTAQRPSGTASQIRYNSTLARVEYYNGAAWQPVANQAWDFTSAATAVSAGNSVTTLAHGLGTIPTKIHTVLRCAITQEGYAVGDEASVDTASMPGLPRLTVAADATNIYISLNNGPPGLTRRDGTDVFTITAANWRWVARASL
jgi:hypothetical protein